MSISIFDMFRVGIGPSSSHTVGPMRAGRQFVRELLQAGLLEQVRRVKIDLLGSLAATGIGHSTDNATLLGLMMENPATIDVDKIPQYIEEIKQTHSLRLGGTHTIEFIRERDLIFSPSQIDPYHTNTIIFDAFDADGHLLRQSKIYSVGGGFIETEEQALANAGSHNYSLDKVPVDYAYPYPYDSAAQMLKHCETNNLSVAEVILANELTRRSQEEINQQLDDIWLVMKECIDRGLVQTSDLFGPFKVKRRANKLYKKLTDQDSADHDDPLRIIDWINVFAFAVSEENAAGGRIITAPTNGAAGVIPAVLNYYVQFVKNADIEGRRRFLLVAGAVGALYKLNASISGAEVGCQGEIGVACSMAAAGLAAALNATPRQIENAAEIAMEHFLGLTCDPVAGQVQIPCIERNAIAAVKAVNAVRMAMNSNGEHIISLDQVIRTMMQTGKDMNSQYKETSLGGLAVCVVEC